MLKSAKVTSISRAGYGLLFLLGLLLALGVASFQPAPGYMDADYYFATGKLLASGSGFAEPFLWNYLDDPPGLPHPSHLYWMPLAGILAAAGIWLREALSGAALSSAVTASTDAWRFTESFVAARAGFIFLAACLPPLTAALTSSFGGDRRQAWMAGLLALFSGFYLPFLTTTDTFGIYMLLGVLFLQACGQLVSKASAGSLQSDLFLPWSALLGALAGLMHLARADGMLWIFIGLAAIWMASKGSADPPGAPERILRRYGSMVVLLFSYLLVVSPWIARNLKLAGSLAAPGVSRALWITGYDELFIYPSALLTPARWWSTGLAEILAGRLWSLGQNLQTTIAIQGEVFLLPLILVGIWRLRADPRIRLGGLAWALTFLFMTLVFPFQGARGGWFHSGAALQPVFWALAPMGLQAIIQWGEQHRGWVSGQARVVFSAGVLGMALLITLATAIPRLDVAGRSGSSWGVSEEVYERLEGSLREAGAPPGASVLVNNPPGYYGATGRPSLVIPDGDEKAVLAVARRYRSSYLLLEPNHPGALEALYRNPGDRPGLDYLLTVAGAHIFYIESD